MWVVTVVPTDSDKSSAEVKISGNTVDALFDGKFFRWEVLNGLMEKGLLRHVKIDFRPSLYGVKRIRKLTWEENGEKVVRYYLTIDNVIASRGYEERGDAWAVG